MDHDAAHERCALDFQRSNAQVGGDVSIKRGGKEQAVVEQPMKSRSRTSADRAAVANHFAIAQHAAFGIIFIPDTVGSAAQAETAVGGEKGRPGSAQNSDIPRVGEFELDLNAFEDERSVGSERNGSELGL